MDPLARARRRFGLFLGFVALSATVAFFVLRHVPLSAEAVRATAEGPITANVPGSILQMHPRTQVFLDEASAARLDRADYYRWVYANKPAWQEIR